MNEIGKDILPMMPDLENIRRKDKEGNEYWSSRELCSALGYSAIRKIGIVSPGIPIYLYAPRSRAAWRGLFRPQK